SLGGAPLYLNRDRAVQQGCGDHSKDRYEADGKHKRLSPLVATVASSQHGGVVEPGGKASGSSTIGTTLNVVDTGFRAPARSWVTCTETRLVHVFPLDDLFGLVGNEG